MIITIVALFALVVIARMAMEIRNLQATVRAMDAEYNDAAEQVDDALLEAYTAGFQEGVKYAGEVHKALTGATAGVYLETLRAAYKAKAPVATEYEPEPDYGYYREYED